MEPVHFHIIVPVYKVEPYLDECVRSVLDQNYSDFTLYLVDDGSPDNCGAMCDAWAEKDGRIRVYHKPNGGALSARCLAIEEAQKGSVTEQDYAVFLDSDDWLNPGALETIAEKIDQYGCDCVIYGAERVLEGEVMTCFPVLAEQDVVITDKRTLYTSVFRGIRFNSMCIKAVRLDRLGTWDFSPWYHIYLGEDTIQSLEVYQNCGSFCFIPDVLYSYRVNPASVTETVCYENYRVDYTVWETETAFLKNENVLTAQEFSAYRSFRIHSFAGELVNIAALDTPRKNRVELYERIRKTAYWRDFLDGGGYDRRELGKMALIYEAFRHRAYWFIFLAQKLYRR